MIELVARSFALNRVVIVEGYARNPVYGAVTFLSIDSLVFLYWEG